MFDLPIARYRRSQRRRDEQEILEIQWKVPPRRFLDAESACDRFQRRIAADFEPIGMPVVTQRYFTPNSQE